MTRPVSGQTVAFEYTVTGTFDGSTPAPAVSLQSSNLSAAQFYTSEAEDLGIIAVEPPAQETESEAVPVQAGARGNRWISWLELELDDPAPPGSVLQLVSLDNDGNVRVLRTLEDYSGLTTLYIGQGFMVPQGGALRLAGGGPGSVRFHTTFLDSGDASLLASLVAAQAAGPGAVVPGDIIRAGTAQSYYQDNPGAQGSGTYAQSFFVDGFGLASELRLAKLKARIDFPAAVGEQAIIRCYRYRKTGPAGAFNYTQVSDSYIITSATPWSWTVDLEYAIRNFTYNPVTDSLAVSNVYTAGGGPTMRALRVDIGFGPA